MTPGGCKRQDSRQRAEHWRPVSATVVALIMVLLATICSTAAAAPRGECNGRIAFDRVDVNGTRKIYAIDAPPDPRRTGAPAPDTTPTPLTTGEGSDAKPSWAPPTQFLCTRPLEEWPLRIAFQRTVNGNTDIYRLDGGRVERITHDPAADTAPAWGPVGNERRGSTIAFERDVNGKRDIFIANLDGTNEKNLTESDDADEGNPEWSPTGISLAFDSDLGGRRELWVMDLAFDSNAMQYNVLAERQVTAGPGGSSFNPSWFAFTNPTPGTDPPQYALDNLTDSLAFAGPDEDGANSHIHTAEYARYDPQNNKTLPFSQTDRISSLTLTSGLKDDTAPVWSPLGDRIAYESNRDGNAEIYVMDPEGETDTDDVNLTQFAGDDKNPDWESLAYRTDETIPVRPRGRRSRRRRARIASITPSPPSQPSPPGERGPMRPPPRPGSDTPKPPGCTIPGTARNDMLRGTANRDVICGKGGDDRIVGLGGNDVVRGDAGNDRIKGGGGGDRILGGAGNDRLHGGGGRDEIKGGPGGDRINAKDRQRDRLSGGPGRDRATVDRRGDRVSGVERLRR
jgi:hypothetical protein